MLFTKLPHIPLVASEARVSQGLSGECPSHARGVQFTAVDLGTPRQRAPGASDPSCAGWEGRKGWTVWALRVLPAGCSVYLTLPWSLTMARHKVPSSGTTCPLSQMAPMKDPRGAKLTPTDSNSRGEGTGGWEGEHTSCQWT